MNRYRCGCECTEWFDCTVMGGSDSLRIATAKRMVRSFLYGGENG